MAIVRMTSRQDFEAHPNDPNYWIEPFYDGAEAGLLRHSPACPHYAAANFRGIKGYEIGPGYADCVGSRDPRRETIVPDNTPGASCVSGTNEAGQFGRFAGSCDGPFEPLYMKRTHVGLVLEDRERNMYDDSDFYAIVWNPDKGATEVVEWGTTRGWCYPNGCSVDATPEVKEAFRAFREARAEVARKEQEAIEAARVRKGRTVEVFKGRKVPKGTRGEVIWQGESAYGPRVGIKDATGAVHWTAESNVRVVQEVR